MSNPWSLPGLTLLAASRLARERVFERFDVMGVTGAGIIFLFLQKIGRAAITLYTKHGTYAEEGQKL